ncbi:MAG: class I SAM-dependent methyltransferase [endosymbiont of Galathealinum brachiosum]|uniref:Class I SAM-dependent methyltransferase n=1 Tax=endosymbiont of Galathealinum brachiosum TaxID=2200906 RepID=A0A370DAD2_9GAMM|nr:MAG: class I SAM-dependent methyltransferase [endosymbiont of Galathealinum brachiosum]
MQTYQQLQKDLGYEIELPITPDWSAAADFLFLIKEYCQKVKPEVIVECSSGLTTLTLARCCQINEKGKVFSLENGHEYADKSRLNLENFSVDSQADIIHAPLKQILVNDRNYDWYELKNLPDVKIDMLVIDGPPGFIQKHSRFPALPLLFDRMADESIVFLDDAAREEEKELVEMWLSMYSEIEHEYIETERGCSVLRINRT